MRICIFIQKNIFVSSENQSNTDWMLVTDFKKYSRIQNWPSEPDYTALSATHQQKRSKTIILSIFSKHASHILQSVLNSKKAPTLLVTK